MGVSLKAQGHEARGPQVGVDDHDRWQIVAEHVEAVRRYCLAQMRNPEDAQDAAQDTFVRFLAQTGPIQNPEGWLINAAKFACADLHRRNRYRRSEELSDQLPADNVENPEAVVIREQSTAELLEQLRPPDRELLEKLYLRGLTVQQVALLLRVSPGNVRVMALRARRRASEALAAMQAAAGPWLPNVMRHLGGIRHFGPAWLRPRPERDAGAAAVAATLFPAALAIVFMTVAPEGPPQLAHPPLQPRSLLARPTIHMTGLELHGPQANSQATGGDQAPRVQYASGTSAWLSSLAPSSTQAPQQDAAFDSLTLSPAYSTDHTVFASGHVVVGCGLACPALYRSSDGGGSWRQLAATNFAGGPVIIPPDFASSKVVFAIGPLGLQRSNDAGSSFETIITGVTAAATVSGSNGTESLVVGGPPLLSYNVKTGAIQPGPTLPVPLVGVSSMVSTSPLGAVEVAGRALDPAASTGYAGEVLHCSTSACSVVWSKADQAPPTLTSTWRAADGTVAAYWADSVALSTDGGMAFQTISLGRLSGGLTAAGLTGDGGVVLSWLDGASPRLALWNGGSSATISTPSESRRVATVVALPNGNWLLGLTSSQPGFGLGIRCSRDRGLTWRLDC